MVLTETHKSDKFVFYASHNPSNDNKIIIQINQLEYVIPVIHVNITFFPTKGKIVNDTR